MCRYAAVPDHESNEVTTVAGSGTAGFKNGAAASAEFFGPNHVALSPDEKIVVVVDTANDRLRYVDLFPASTAPSAGEPWLVGLALFFLFLLTFLDFLASFVISHRHTLFTTLFCSQNIS